MSEPVERIPSGQFRRKYPRRNFRREVGILNSGEYTVCSAVEIGEGGLSLLTRNAMSVDHDIVVNFQIPLGGFVSVRAEIKTCRKDEAKDGFVLGCAFKNLVFERKREIRSYVSARD